MKDIAKENALLTKAAEENLAKRLAAIEKEGAETIKRLVSETEKQTAAHIAQVQEEYRKKGETYEKEFERNRQILRGKIFHDVLHGEL
jgi:Skp family chaperone for outer membrane proteins